MTIEKLIKYLSTIPNTQKEVVITDKEIELNQIVDTPKKLILTTKKNIK